VIDCSPIKTASAKYPENVNLSTYLTVTLS